MSQQGERLRREDARVGVGWSRAHEEAGGDLEKEEGKERERERRERKKKKEAGELLSGVV